MAQYWSMAVPRGASGGTMRLIIYANDAQSAMSRARQWLQSNPFQLGATDLNAYMQQFNSSSQSMTPSDQRPPAQAGDTTLDLPSGDPGGTGGTPPPDVQKDFGREPYYAGLRSAGRDPYGAFGKYLREQYEPTETTFRFGELLGQPNPQGFEAYASGNARQGRSALDRNAASMFNQLAGEGKDYDPSQPSFTDERRGQLYNAAVGDDGGALRGDALNLAKSAARSRMSSYWADNAFDDKRILQDFGEELYRNTGAGGDKGLNFIDFLRRKYRV